MRKLIEYYNKAKQAFIGWQIEKRNRLQPDIPLVYQAMHAKLMRQEAAESALNSIIERVNKNSCGRISKGAVDKICRQEGYDCDET